MAYFDAHTHPQFAAYDDDRNEVIKRAQNAKVKLIAVGTALGTSRGAIALAEAHPDLVWATVGVHPTHFTSDFHDEKEHHAPDIEPFNSETLKELAQHEKVVAIGECGLDYYRIEEGEKMKEKQKEGFLAQIEVAKAVQKPLMIHCRNAFPELIRILLDARFSILDSRPSGVIHFMSGTKDDARQLLDLGFAFTFGGVVTFTKDYDEVIRYLPKERILSETDAPYVAPVPYRGRRNEPCYVVEVVKRLAELKGLSLEAMQEKISENASRIFGIT